MSVCDIGFSPLFKQEFPGFLQKDGRVFIIDEVKDYRPYSSPSAGFTGGCYTIRIHGETKHLFFEKTDPRFNSTIGR